MTPRQRLWERVRRMVRMLSRSEAAAISAAPIIGRARVHIAISRGHYTGWSNARQMRAALRAWRRGGAMKTWREIRDEPRPRITWTDDALQADGIGDGWLPIVRTAVRLVEMKREVVQVKQKFGGLRIYYHGAPDAECDETIRLAEDLCARTCERCGANGRMARSGEYVWVSCGRCEP